MINSKRKGKVGELEVVNLLKEKGLTARRTQQFSGKADGTSDVLCEELSNFHIEVKRDEHLNIEKALQQSIRDSEIENILNKNRQLIKKYEQYQNTLSFIREKDETDAIQNEFISHFSQFGVNKDSGVVVYGYFGKMIISLDNKLHLVVQVDSSDESLISVFSAVLNKGNYKRVFDNVDDLIHEFKEKSPDSDTYLELLKESIC